MAGEVEPIIRVRDLSVGYDDFVLLEHVSFDVRRGEIFVILGGSGSGKSTLLKHMIGLIEPQAEASSSTATTSSPRRPTTRHAILRSSESCTSRARCSAR